MRMVNVLTTRWPTPASVVDHVIGGARVVAMDSDTLPPKRRALHGLSSEMVAILGVGATLLGVAAASWADSRSFRAESRAEHAEIRREIGNLRTELRSDMGKLRTELRTDMAKLDDRLRTVELGLATTKQP